MKTRYRNKGLLVEFEEGLEEYIDNVVIGPNGSRLDYAYDVGNAWCGDWCPCGSNLEYWMDWLRSQEVYPPPPLAVEIGQRYNYN